MGTYGEYVNFYIRDKQLITCIDKLLNRKRKAHNEYTLSNTKDNNTIDVLNVTKVVSDDYKVFILR